MAWTATWLGVRAPPGPAPSWTRWPTRQWCWEASVRLAALGRLPWLPVILIAVREIGMQLYRSWVGRRGVSIPARNSAKLKTFVQDLSIGSCLAPPLVHHHTVTLTIVWVATALTLYTGLQYFFDGRRAAHESTTESTTEATT